MKTIRRGHSRLTMVLRDHAPGSGGMSTDRIGIVLKIYQVLMDPVQRQLSKFVHRLVIIVAIKSNTPLINRREREVPRFGVFFFLDGMERV